MYLRLGANIAGNCYSRRVVVVQPGYEYDVAFNTVLDSGGKYVGGR
jgi:hypothetical protein